MKKYFVSTLVGFIIATIFWMGLYLYLWRPRDFSAQVSKSIVGDPKTNFVYQSIKKARCYNFGQLQIIVPFDKGERMLAMICMNKKPFEPLIFVNDFNSDGRIDTIWLMDKYKRCFEIIDKNDDAIWDNYSFSADISTNTITYIDVNMDGKFDFEFGGPRKFRDMRN